MLRELFDSIGTKGQLYFFGVAMIGVGVTLMTQLLGAFFLTLGIGTMFYLWIRLMADC